MNLCSKLDDGGEIGKSPDSDVTYYGIVELINEGNLLRVSRKIDGKVVVGEGK